MYVYLTEEEARRRLNSPDNLSRDVRVKDSGVTTNIIRLFRLSCGDTVAEDAPPIPVEVVRPT